MKSLPMTLRYVLFYIFIYTENTIFSSDETVLQFNLLCLLASWFSLISSSSDTFLCNTPPLHTVMLDQRRGLSHRASPSTGETQTLMNILTQTYHCFPKSQVTTNQFLKVCELLHTFFLNEVNASQKKYLIKGGSRLILKIHICQK